MKLNEFARIDELRYKGNLGMMEMVEFYKVATPEQKAHMKSLIAQQKTEEAWNFLQQVTNTKLDPN